METLVVKTVKPGHELRLKVLVVVAIVLVGVTCYFWGADVKDERMLVINRQDETIRQLVVERDQLKQDYQNLRTSKDVDSAALELSRQEIERLQSTLAANREELSLYRTLLKDSNLPKGISVQQVSFFPTEIDRRYRYRWVLLQKNNKTKTIKVYANLELQVKTPKGTVTKSIAHFDNSIEDVPLVLEYKYFRIMQGFIELPEGVEPLQMNISVSLASGGNPEFSRSYLWRLEN